MIHDTAVIGAGICGASVALRLAERGHTVAILDRRGICMEASGVNAGTISALWVKPYLLPYAIEGLRCWAGAKDRMGVDVPLHRTGSLKLALTDEEAGTLEAEIEEFRHEGLDVRLLTAADLRRDFPEISSDVRAACWTAEDGYVYSADAQRRFHEALSAGGVARFLDCGVASIAPTGRGYEIQAGDATVTARRIVLAGGVWNQELLAQLGLDVALGCRVSQVVVTDRAGPMLRPMLGVVRDTLSLKQLRNGCVLIGGGWQGRTDAARRRGEVLPDVLVGNVRLAHHVLPALGSVRVVRSWVGHEARAADLRPMVGALPGLPDAYVIGAIHTGYTLGPYLAELLADRIVGRDTAHPLFPPDRLFAPATAA